MTLDRKQSGSFISGSTIYAYTEVDWTITATHFLYDHAGGVNSPVGGWGNNPSATLYWREWNRNAGEWGSWVSYGSGSAYYTGPGDKELVKLTNESFERRSYDREIQLDCDVYATSDTGSGTGSAMLYYIVPHLPQPITNLSAEKRSENEIRLTWDNPSSSYYAFILEVQIDSGSWKQCWYYNGAGYPTSYNYTNLSPDHSYRFRARTEYNRAYSAYTSATTAIVTIPAAPTAISTAPVSGTTVTATVTNQSPVSATLQYALSVDGNNDNIGAITNAPSLTSLGEVNMNDGTRVNKFIHVRNVNAAGMSDWFVSNQIITITPPAAPTVYSPTADKIDIADGSVRWAWNFNTIDGSEQSEFEAKFIKNDSQTATHTGTTAKAINMTLGGMTAGTKCEFSVRTKGAATSPNNGWSPWSDSKIVYFYYAPTVVINLPVSPIVGMPLEIAARYTDMVLPNVEPFKCIEAKVKIMKDGELLKEKACVIHEEPIDAQGNNITAVFTTDEFLPTNGQSYDIVITVLSSSELSASSSVTLDVDFIPPSEGSLTITNDQETGFVNITAEFDPEGADNISVSRIGADGSPMPLISKAHSLVGVVDMYAPINVPYQYAVTTEDEGTHAVNTVYVDVIFRSPKAYFYFDGSVASAMWQQTGSVNYERPQQEELYLSGRELPILVDDIARGAQGSVGFALRTKEEVKAFKKLMKHSGSVVYKSTDGEVFHAKVWLGFSRVVDTVSYYLCQISINYKQVDGIEL